MIAFAAAVFFLIITPGPGVLSTAGVGAAFGYRPGARYVVGLFIGTNLVALSVVTGYAALLLDIPNSRIILFAVSVSYLLYLAARIAFAGSRLAFIHAERAPGISGGLALQAVNPKAYVVNTALFTGFPFWPENLTGELLVKFAIMNAIWIPIHFLWLHAGVALHRLDLSPSAHRTINIAMAGAMLAVVAIATIATLRRETALPAT